MDTTMHGFRLVSSSELKEIKGTADIYKHDKSGLTMVHLNCADTNKAFAMSFCTPPENSTGVPHILEHSVLAGSDKYPVPQIRFGSALPITTGDRPDGPSRNPETLPVSATPP